MLADELMRQSVAKILKLIVGPAPMMTSLDMQGFSVSVCRWRAPRRRRCSRPWRPGLAGLPHGHQVEVVELPDGLTPDPADPVRHEETAAFLTRCCEILIAAEADLNALDAKSGDGDTGSTLATAARALIGAMDRMPLADQTQLYRAIGQELSQTMGGSSGVLLAIFFTAAGDAASSGLPMVEAMKAGLGRMQKIGGARLGDRTMVDALQPALDELENGIAPAAHAAREGAVLTSTMVKANAGRASYISSEQLQGHIDPGAEAVARLFEQLSN